MIEGCVYIFPSSEIKHLSLLIAYDIDKNLLIQATDATKNSEHNKMPEFIDSSLLC